MLATVPEGIQSTMMEKAWWQRHGACVTVRKQIDHISSSHRKDRQTYGYVRPERDKRETPMRPESGAELSERSYNFSQTAPPAGNQVFEHMSLWEAFPIQTIAEAKAQKSVTEEPRVCICMGKVGKDDAPWGQREGHGVCGGGKR